MALTAQGPGDMSGLMSATPSLAMGGHAMAHTMATSRGRSVSITAAHLGATIVTDWFLARGEQAWWRLVARC